MTVRLFVVATLLAVFTNVVLYGLVPGFAMFHLVVLGLTIALVIAMAADLPRRKRTGRRRGARA